jgi:hypothetical protein
VRLAWNGFGLLRLGIALFLLYALISDTGARLARIRYAALPDFDYTSEVGYLRQQGRFGEALMVADAGLQVVPQPGRSALQAERDLVAKAQGSYLRRARDLGLGAISGQGSSLESLLGAVTADFFVVGDIRDLAIQGGRLVLDGETDEVILVLSGIGLATTLAPEVDWVPAILKAARKSGAMSVRLGEHLVRTARAGRARDLLPLFRDVRRLSDRASPGGAMRLLRHADTPEDVASLAGFLERQPSGAFALHVAGKEGADIARGAKRIAGVSGEAAERALVMAARKGDKGVVWLRTGGYKALARPHLLVGLGKALWKGNAQELAARIAAAVDPRAWWLIPALAAWVFLEIAVLGRKVGRRVLGERLVAGPAPA